MEWMAGFRELRAGGDDGLCLRAKACCYGELCALEELIHGREKVDHEWREPCSEAV